MTKEEVNIMSDKIIKGVELAYQRLIIAKAKEDGELVFSRNGKIVTIKARDLLNDSAGDCQSPAE